MIALAINFLFFSLYLFLMLPSLAYAQPSASHLDVTTIAASGDFVLETMLILIAGVMVCFMVAGFFLREVGGAQSKKITMLCLKNISLFSVAGLSFWLIGHPLYSSIEAGGYLGRFGFFGDFTGVNEGSFDIGHFGIGHSAYASLMYHVGLVVVCASIVSGALGQRAGLWGFLIFTALLCGVLYPVQASWYWGGGWLQEIGFIDYSGALLVHGAGGFAALAGSLVLGAISNTDAEEEDSQSYRDQPESLKEARLPLAVMGALILWLGFVWLCAGSQLGLIPQAEGAFSKLPPSSNGGEATNIIVTNIARIFMNVHLAMCSSVLFSFIFTRIIFGKVHLLLVLSGAIGGMVSISGDPLSPSAWQAACIGVIGGIIVIAATRLLKQLNVEDNIGAIPAHLLCGLWGILVVAWTNPSASLMAQFIAIAAVGTFIFVMSILIWLTLKYSLNENIA